MSGITVQPLAGYGLAARDGELLLLCADSGDGVDDLMAALAEVAAAGGDGGLLVRRIAALLANDVDARVRACAACGPASGGRLAVLVYGDATAQVSTVDGEVGLSGADAVTSVDRLITGPVAVRLELPGAGPAHPRARLDGGVVVAGGIQANLGSPAASSIASAAPVAASVEPAAPFTPPAAPIGLPDAATPADAPVEPEPPAYADPAVYTEPPAYAEAPAEPPAYSEALVSAEPAYMPAAQGPDDTELAAAPAVEPASVLVDSATWPPTEAAGEAEPLPVRPRRPEPESAPAEPAPADVAPVAIGVLVLDDGSAFQLDQDYLIGREPQADPSVAAGVARPLRLADPDGLVSRRHVRITVAGSEVQVVDLGSANGTFIQRPGEAGQQLTALQPAVLWPGSVITMGRRWIRFDAHS